LKLGYIKLEKKMGDLSKNLSRKEFACKCGCGFDTADQETIRVIQDVCDNFECSVTITSGCRCPAHNRAVGSAIKNSQHLLGRAADCVFMLDGNPIEPTEIHYYLVSEHEGYGFGLYETFNHIDTRSEKPARWGA
jgi:uncharacterized protein YcbK (DUF882 family)